MSSSKNPPGNKNGNGSGSAQSLYARFIPREELGQFAAWNPHTFGDTLPGDPGEAVKAATVQATAGQPEVSISKGRHARGDHKAPAQQENAAQQASREAGYREGYRDGLAALDAYKHAYAAQVGTQVAAIASEFHQRLEALEQQLAGRMAGVALDLARQILRSEISQRPELVVTVAEEALSTLLTTAKQISVRLHPDDLSVVAHSLSEVLKARGAQLIADPRISRGGCLVDSDIAAVDASIQSRWLRACRVFGSGDVWRDEPAPPTRSHFSAAAKPTPATPQADAGAHAPAEPSAPSDRGSES